MARARITWRRDSGHHPHRSVIAALYPQSGPDGGRWLNEHQFKQTLRHFVEMVNVGKLAGLRIFATHQFQERPEYVAVVTSPAP